jgi:hypothetical protein
MQQSDMPTNNDIRTDWQILGDLKLLVDSDADVAIHTRLVELLAPLSLNADFLNKVLRSAQASITRALQPNHDMTVRHVHLSIFAPYEHTSKGGIWGFFRIEKTDCRDQDKDHPDHAVEFYLYLEG